MLILLQLLYIDNNLGNTCEKKLERCSSQAECGPNSICSPEEGACTCIEGFRYFYIIYFKTNSLHYCFNRFFQIHV